MKKPGAGVLLVLLLAGGSYAAAPLIDPEDISLKAGPTDAGEALTFVWLETYVYPKVVKGDRVASLGARLTSRVDSVTVQCDFSKKEISLSSEDGLSWSGGYQVPPEITAGLHVARFKIACGGRGIQRVVDFFVAESNQANDQATRTGQDSQDFAGWPLTVKATCAAFSQNSGRILYGGEVITGISKAPWYRVMFEDGEAGWVAANMVTEPVDQFFALGFQNYQHGRYQAALDNFGRTIAIDEKFKDGYFWLAKSYYRLGELEPAARSLKQALALDERDLESRVLAQAIAYDYYKIGHSSFQSGDYSQAAAALKNVVSLKPSSLASWIELGRSYEQLGLKDEARNAWREALRIDPDKPELYALLDLNISPLAVGSAARIAAVNLPQMPADDSLKIVREIKTQKGTRIEEALKSVITLTKSLGTPVVEQGWKVKKEGDKYLVRYLCEQGSGALESFDWLVDIGSKRAQANNDNARMLMNRW